ncbi:CDGSH iron-sulfur domain-containing protein [Pseudomonas sp. BN102]|uniref:CDGSH iron-sulfur domain-containing protein n=1 Tax=Pseudomonas sp. BN102 TaxID=2567886 RepID=UPI0024585F66|nr:CDGSH iron-sulfur domain-containing protein [Pseudomonas sp. BN102]MDH4611355.1 CDGSH iron-sulfur domain-containing protein [Pseudomonas sp. BN102]
MPDPLLPEVRLLQPGDRCLLCRCGRSAQLPDCPAGCAEGVHLTARREQRLLLCRCGQSGRLPWCDGSHSPPTPGLGQRWRRFWKGE